MQVQHLSGEDELREVQEELFRFKGLARRNEALDTRSTEAEANEISLLKEMNEVLQERDRARGDRSMVEARVTELEGKLLTIPRKLLEEQGLLQIAQRDLESQHETLAQQGLRPSDLTCRIHELTN